VQAAVEPVVAVVENRNPVDFFQSLRDDLRRCTLLLPGDRPVPPIVVPKGTYPAWSPTTIYEKGDRPLFDGRILETKWWNQGESPQAGDRAAAVTR